MRYFHAQSASKCWDRSASHSFQWHWTLDMHTCARSYKWRRMHPCINSHLYRCIYMSLQYFTTIYIHDWMHCTSASYLPLQSFTFQATWKRSWIGSILWIRILPLLFWTSQSADRVWVWWESPSLACCTSMPRARRSVEIKIREEPERNSRMTRSRSSHCQSISKFWM